MTGCGPCMVVAALCCVLAVATSASAECAWVMWAVHQEVLSSPEIPRPVDTYRTKQECETQKVAQYRLESAKLDKLDGENQQRANEAAVVVKNLRAKRGWTQQELAERSGVMQRVISQVESSTPMSLGIAEAYALADALGVSVEESKRWFAHFPRNIVSQLQCWPDTVDPRGPKTK